MSETLTEVLQIREQLDVLNKYESLVQSSLGSNSVYIRTKETLNQLAEDGDIKDADKAKILAEVLTNLNSAIVSSSMNTALQWASNEMDIKLKKLEMNLSLQIMKEDLLVKQNHVKTSQAETVRTKAETWALYGVTGIDTNGLVVKDTAIVIPANSKIGAEINVASKQALNITEETNLTKNKIKESNVSINKIVADTVTNYGVFNGYNIGDDGKLTSVSRTTASGINYVLSDIQANIAIEQAKGYAYNAWANAATGSASIIGTILATEGGKDDALFAPYVSMAVANLTKLESAQVPYCNTTACTNLKPGTGNT